jgi:hypothetical protein
MGDYVPPGMEWVPPPTSYAYNVFFWHDQHIKTVPTLIVQPLVPAGCRIVQRNEDRNVTGSNDAS